MFLPSHYAGCSHPTSSSPFTSSRRTGWGDHTSYFAGPSRRSGSRYFTLEDPEEQEYYQLLDAARREQERKELLRAQAERRAREEAYLAEVFRRQKEQEAAEEEYRRRVRAAEVARARAIAEERARQRAAAEDQRQNEANEALKHLWSSLFTRPHEVSPTTPSEHRPICIPVEFVQSGSRPAAQQQSAAEPAVRPASPRPQSSRMTYSQAVETVRRLAREQVSIRQRLHTIRNHREEFETAKANFSVPETLEFNTEASTASTPALAFSTVNRPLQAYEETLTRLLTKLDEVSSGGYSRVKGERKALVTDIEDELSRLDSLKVELYKKQHSGSSSEAEGEAAITEADKMITDDDAAQSTTNTEDVDKTNLSGNTSDVAADTNEDHSFRAEESSATSAATEETGDSTEVAHDTEMLEASVGTSTDIEIEESTGTPTSIEIEQQSSDADPSGSVVITDSQSAEQHESAETSTDALTSDNPETTPAAEAEPRQSVETSLDPEEDDSTQVDVSDAPVSEEIETHQSNVSGSSVPAETNPRPEVDDASDSSDFEML